MFLFWQRGNECAGEFHHFPRTMERAVSGARMALASSEFLAGTPAVSLWWAEERNQMGSRTDCLRGRPPIFRGLWELGACEVAQKWECTWAHLSSRVPDLSQGLSVNFTKPEYMTSPNTVRACYVTSVVSLCNPMDCNLTRSSVHQILQARILEWVAISSFRGVFQTQGSNPCLFVSCTG